LFVRRDIYMDGPSGYPPVNGFYSHESGQIVLEFGQYAWGNLTQRFVWGPETDQLLIDELNSALYGSVEIYYPLADQQQTIHDAAKYIVSAGAVKVVTHRYLDAYGSGGSWSNFEGSGYDGGLFMYTGRFIDQLTGLQWHLHRWYDPALGRWLSEDPIGFAGDPWNLYRYVGNSPTNGTDPSGLRQVNLVVKYAFKSMYIGPQTQTEFDRIFHDMMRRFSYKDRSTNRYCHTLKVFWISLGADYNSIENTRLGFIGRPVTWFVAGVDDGATSGVKDFAAQTGGFQTTVDRNRAFDWAKANKLFIDAALGVILAHEIGLHQIGEKSDHFYQGTEWVDSRYGNPTGVFSNEAGKLIAKKLQVDRP
jgi:RHS repeat-associated protein